MIRNVLIIIALLACPLAALAEPSKDKGFFLAGATQLSLQVIF
ncbi:MAG: hypothetical protein P8X81_03355 [Woeseiaceae bacterium]|jgi:hypothetical protein